MIVEFIDNPQSKYLDQCSYIKDRIDFGEKMLVLKIEISLSSQEILYTVINQDNTDLSELSIYWDNFKVICDKMPSNWVFKYEEDINYGKRTYLFPNRWLDDKPWTFSFWEALYCGGDTGYEKLSSKEEERAKQVFLEEAKKIYEECGKGWVPNPFE